MTADQAVMRLCDNGGNLIVRKCPKEDCVLVTGNLHNYTITKHIPSNNLCVGESTGIMQSAILETALEILRGSE